MDVHGRSHWRSARPRIQKREVMRRKPSRLRLIWRRRTRLSAGFACLVEWKFAEGLAELKRAKELSPANPTANDLLARVIVYLGRIDEAERQARQAVELDPLSTVTQGNLARVLFYAGKLDEADAVARKAAELQPTGAGSHRWQVLIAAQRGDGEAALREAQLEPDRRLSPFRTRARTLCAWRSSGSRRGTGRPDRQWPEKGLRIKSLRFTPCAARKTKLSSGCKSRLMIATPGCSAF